VAPVDGSAVRYVAPRGGFPAWSPDGSWIAFRSEADGRTKLSIAHPDGSGIREVASVEGRHDAYTHNAWSPDSTRLAYHRPVPNAPAVVAVFDLSSGRETVVSRAGAGISSVPNWSTDSRRLAYFEEVDDGGGAYHQELVTVAADGTDRTELGPVGGCVAYWSPDSRYLISYAERCFGTKLVVIPADGGEPRTITLPGAIVGSPSWQRLPPT
jgi:Tol biopolymer transport system component